MNEMLLFTDGMPGTQEESRNHMKYHYLIQGAPPGWLSARGVLLDVFKDESLTVWQWLHVLFSSESKIAQLEVFRAPPAKEQKASKGAWVARQKLPVENKTE